MQPARNSDRSIPVFATDLGIASEALCRWLRRAEADAGQGWPGALTTRERERRLRRFKSHGHAQRPRAA